ncbi:MAG: MBL fold metallo-hydrolase [Deltaproteobacteria bacterium]|nr:MBL fold metallo-hydrolase [Deltaproteobacteria bacterium]MBI3078368.1 MBL fold metallo-hydrolase [Deltaproteobacteria bacterium]
MRIGRFDIFPLVDNHFRLDGGMFFGVVPRVMWEKVFAADPRHRVEFAVRVLLIRDGRHNILVDTGIGGKLDPKLAERYGVSRPPGLLPALKAHGLTPEEIDLVLFTHLHFDHAGGNTWREDGRLRPTFPRARHLVQKGEWGQALEPDARSRAGYFPEDLEPLEEAGLVELYEGEAELLPGIQTFPTGGHTRHHQCVKITSEGQTALYLGDIMPTAFQAPPAYTSAIDLYPVEVMEAKAGILEQACRESWLLIFDHDPFTPFGAVEVREGKTAVEPVPGEP